LTGAAQGRKRADDTQVCSSVQCPGNVSYVAIYRSTSKDLADGSIADGWIAIAVTKCVISAADHRS